MNVDRPEVSWSTPIHACVLIATGATFRTASKIALVVGTLLTVVNQGSVIVSGDAVGATWVRTVTNSLAATNPPAPPPITTTS